MNGQLKRGYTHNSLKKELEGIFLTEPEKTVVPKIFTHKKDRNNGKKEGEENGK
jgi:hypothetical protein